MKKCLKKMILTLITLTMLQGVLCALPTTAGTLITPGVMSIKHLDEVLVTSDIGETLAVGAIYGIEVAPTLSRSVTIDTLVDFVTFNHQIINYSNSTANILVELNKSTGHWEHQYVIDDNGNDILEETETTTFNSPLAMRPATTLNFFVNLIPNRMSSIETELLVSLNNLPVVRYTGFNGILYGGGASLNVADNIVFTGNITPSITLISPTENAQNVLPNQNIIIDINSIAFNIVSRSIDIFINNELAIASGNFTANYLGGSSVLIPSANGYRIIIDKVSILPQNVSNSIFVQAANSIGNIATANYQFKTTIIETIKVQLQALLQGYYDSVADQMIPATVRLEFRNERHLPATTSFNIPLNSDGTSPLLELWEIASGQYYIYIDHFNHISVATEEKISLGETVTTVNLCEPSSGYFKEIYLSSSAQNTTTALRTEENNKLTIRGGDYNGDNTINIVDWSAFDYEWKNGGIIADFDGNGIIDTRDYGIWLSNNQDYLPLE